MDLVESNQTSIREQMQKFANENYQEYIESIISIETGITDSLQLNTLYEEWMREDVGLLNDSIEENLQDLVLREDASIEEEGIDFS